MELQKAEVRQAYLVERAGEVSKEETEDLYRKFQGIINDLTPQKFQSLAKQALKLNISTEERLSGCVNMIFMKVIFFLQT